ncbi:hypothetical protein GCM10020331_056380 [Ectobacillus funiculus]
MSSLNATIELFFSNLVQTLKTVFLEGGRKMESLYYTVSYLGLFAAAVGLSSYMYYKLMTE